MHKTYRNDTIEATVIEVSPSGERVKFRYVSGYESWNLADEYIVSEILASNTRNSYKRLWSWYEM